MPTPYFDELIQALAPRADAGAQTGARAIAESAGGATAQRLRGLVEDVRQSLTDAGPSAEVLQAALGRLRELSAAYDESGIEAAAEATYGEAAAGATYGEAVAGVPHERAESIRVDVELLLAHEAAPQATARLLGMQAYVRRAGIPELDPNLDQHELAIDRRLLLQRLSPMLALDAPHQLDELEASFAIFRRRYLELYVQRHRAYHDIVTRLRQEFAGEHTSRLQALRLLNEIPALGAAVGSDLELRAQAILARVVQCDRPDGSVREALGTTPRCPTCDLDLLAAPPSAEVAQWHDDCLAALRLQQRRLARAAVARAAARKQDPAIERFLRVAQASDVLPLIDVMDEPVQALIRDLLADQ